MHSNNLWDVSCSFHKAQGFYLLDSEFTKIWPVWKKFIQKFGKLFHTSLWILFSDFTTFALPSRLFFPTWLLDRWESTINLKNSSAKYFQNSFKWSYFSPHLIYRKVASSRLVYYSILESFGQRSQYISIKFPLHKESENPWTCY